MAMAPSIIKRRQAMTTASAGIDYSNGISNVNHETGIHYGVIHQHEVLQAWAEASEAFYGDMNCECGHLIKEDDGDECPNCKADVSDRYDFAEAVSFFIDDADYSAESDDSGDIFITKSPFYTKCAFCSPCAPGAGYVMDSRKEGIKAYCFGHDFFDSGKAPYKVYSVKTNRIVKAEEA
jgi:hypothetical protein